MTQANAVSKPEVAIVPPRPDNLHEAIDLLHVSQITGDYRYPALALAGPLLSEVGRIFPLHMILIYLTTSYKRRQVWHAYIAAMFADPTNPRPITDPESVRAKLMNTSSKSLIIEAYGSILASYISSLGRLGLEGQEPRIYLLMHKFMTESQGLQKSLSHASKIDASTITTLAALPLPLRSYDLAKQIKKLDEIKKLIFVIGMLAQDDEAKNTELCEMVVTAAERKHSISAVLKREYYLTPFPEPAICDTEFCKHIGNAFELQKTAHQFSNCLKDYCEEGIRGEYQYYRWYEDGRPVAVISIREDAPFGYRLTEIQGKRNEYIDDNLEQKIVFHFETYGIHKMASIEGLLRELGAMLNRGGRRRDPADEINDFIGELLDEGNQF